ncbi:unnamed protein product [Effrenium voratum]|uniref:AAA+ ATPase domain-containing protein n=1 Tax=Effrenium voratum TaxID=2562239 RepID=A0AA36JJE0_9DINO|nr:unnamed protein product [Effrenium voratum]
MAMMRTRTKSRGMCLCLLGIALALLVQPSTDFARGVPGLKDSILAQFSELPAAQADCTLALSVKTAPVACRSRSARRGCARGQQWPGPARSRGGGGPSEKATSQLLAQVVAEADRVLEDNGTAKETKAVWRKAQKIYPGKWTLSGLKDELQQKLREFVEEAKAASKGLNEDLLLARQQLKLALAQQEAAQEQEVKAVARLEKAEESGKVQEAERKVEKAERKVEKAERKVERAKKEVKEAKASGRTKESEGASRLQRYLAPKYVVREKDIDGEKLLVCDFKDSAKFAIVSSELMQNLTAWVEDCVSSRRICAINGMVKTGKSTVLTRLLPQIILTKIPNAAICVLDFANFLNAGAEPGAMEERLLKEVCSWATGAGFDVRPAHQLTLNQLMDNLDRSGRTVFFLIDEVQRFFQVQEGTIPIWDILKGFLRVSIEDSNLHFAITGSGMVLAWQNFVRMTCNGFTFPGVCRRFFLPWQNPVQELDYARQEFLAAAANEAEREELSELLGEIPSVPLMAYTAAVWKDEPSKDDAQKRVSMKLRNEFVTEMTPLLADPSRHVCGTLETWPMVRQPLTQQFFLMRPCTTASSRHILMRRTATSLL